MVRFAAIEDLTRVNELRKQVNDVHVNGRPDIFRSGFNQELQDHILVFQNAEDRGIIVAERDGVICGFACISLYLKPESPFTQERKFYAVEEFGVDEPFRRQGIGRELFAFIQEDAKARGFDKIELNMWEFNKSALAFYEALGFKTYRRSMEFDNR